MHTVEGMLVLVSGERHGEAVDRTRLKSLVSMFSNMGVYAEEFEKPFLAHSEQHYQVEGMRLMNELDTPAYLAHCEVWCEANTHLRYTYTPCMHTCTHHACTERLNRASY